MKGTTSGRPVPMAVWQAGLGLAFLLAWQWGADAKLLDKFFFSRPSDVVARMWQWIASGSIWGHLAVTFTEALLSFAIGVCCGVLFGFLLARVPLLAVLLDPYIKIEPRFNELFRAIWSDLREEVLKSYERNN